MEEQFYGDKLIDSSNIWCWRIIVSTCDGKHVYADPCLVLKDCIADRPPIDWCDMVTDLWGNAWEILRVTNDWSCVEFVPASFFDTDVLVKVSANDDAAWYLEDKIVSCDNNLLEITVINEGWNEKLQFCPNIPTRFTDLLDVPSAYPNCFWNVVFWPTGVWFECFESKQRFATYYASSDLTFTPPTGEEAVFFPLWTLWTYVPNPAQELTVFRGKGEMDWGWGTINIRETWLYEVRCTATWRSNYHVQSWRIFVASNNTKNMLCDAKVGWDTFTPLPNLDSGWQFRFDTLYARSLVRLEAWDVLITGIRISTFLQPNVLTPYTHIVAPYQPELRLFRSTLGAGSYDDWAEFSDPSAGICFWVRFIQNETYNLP